MSQGKIQWLALVNTAINIINTPPEVGDFLIRPATISFSRNTPHCGVKHLA
jgi:hypothetical protein